MKKGELKSFTQGIHCGYTTKTHFTPNFANIPFLSCKIGLKTQQTLFVGFDRDNNFIGSPLTPESDPKHYEELEQDFPRHMRRYLKCVS